MATLSDSAGAEGGPLSQAIYSERVEGDDQLAGRTLEDAARELGFDPDELFEASPREGVAPTR